MLSCYGAKTDSFDEGRDNFHHTAKISKCDEVKEDVASRIASRMERVMEILRDLYEAW